MNAALSRQAGKHWRGQVGAALTSPAYEVNDLGFAYRTDRRDVEGAVTYVENAPGSFLRRWSSNTAVRSEHNFANEPILTIVSWQYSATTLGYTAVSARAARQFRSFDDRLTRGGPIAIRPSQWSGAVALASDGR